MGLLSDKLRLVDDGGLTYWCPGCQLSHTVWVGDGNPPRWAWNGDAELPTFSPSVLVQGAKPSDDPEQFDDGAYDVPYRCHHFVGGANGLAPGFVQFLEDCTHELRGQTVPLPDLPAHMRV